MGRLRVLRDRGRSGGSGTVLANRLAVHGEGSCVVPLTSGDAATAGHGTDAVRGFPKMLAVQRRRSRARRREVVVECGVCCPALETPSILCSWDKAERGAARGCLKPEEVSPPEHVAT